MPAATNLLPYDGEVHYFGTIMSRAEADAYMQVLMDDIVWKNDEAVIFGKHFITKRKVAWYGDQSFSYTYSNITKEALPWTPELLSLKNLSEKISGLGFNSCLLNFIIQVTKGWPGTVMMKNRSYPMRGLLP